MSTQEHNTTTADAIQCQIYNEWTMGNTGTGPECRLIIQSPTGAAYYIDYPTYSKYHYEPNEGTPKKEIGVRMYSMLHHIVVDSGKVFTETWTMPVPIKYMELIRDYGMPITMPKLDWMETWVGLQTTINNTITI